MDKMDWKAVMLIAVTVLYLVVMAVLFWRFRIAMRRMAEEQKRLREQAEEERKKLENGEEDHGQT